MTSADRLRDALLKAGYKAVILHEDGIFRPVPNKELYKAKNKPKETETDQNHSAVK